MLGFGKPRPSKSSSSSRRSPRYRVESRPQLVARFDLICLEGEGDGRDERTRLARVLEEMAGDGWRLVGVSGEDFIFRRRQ